MKKLIGIMLMALALVAGAAQAKRISKPVTVDGQVFETGAHAFPVTANYVGATYNLDKLTGVKKGPKALGGSDIGYDYVGNLHPDAPIHLVFQHPIFDQPGDDIQIAQIRFEEYSPPTADRHAIEYSFDGINYHRLDSFDFQLAKDFPAVLPNHYLDPALRYQVYHATVDLAWHGLGPVTELYIRGVGTVDTPSGVIVGTTNLAYVANLNTDRIRDIYPPVVELTKYGSYRTGSGAPYYYVTFNARDAGGIRMFRVQYMIVRGKGSKYEELDRIMHRDWRYAPFQETKTVTAPLPDLPPGTLLKFRHVVVDQSFNRTVILKRAIVRKNGTLRFKD